MTNNNVTDIKFNDFMKQIRKDKIIKYGNIDVYLLPFSSRKDEIPNGVTINIIPINNKYDIDLYQIIIKRDYIDDPFSITRIINSKVKQSKITTTVNEYEIYNLISFISSSITNPYNNIFNSISSFFNIEYRNFDKILILNDFNLLFNLYIKNLEILFKEIDSYNDKKELDITHAIGEIDESEVYLCSISPSIDNIDCINLDIAFMISKNDQSNTIEFTKLFSKGITKNRFTDSYKLCLSKNNKKLDILFKLLKKYGAYDQDDIDEIMK